MTGTPLSKRRVQPLGEDGKRKAVGKMLLVSALVALLVFSGCAKSPGTTTTSAVPTTTSAVATTSTAATAKTTTTTSVKTTATPSSTAPTGPYGKLTVAVSTFGEERFYPPTSTTTAVWAIQGMMFDWMFGLKGANLAPGIVEKWELTADGSSWTYHVRKGVKFHNGDDLTAQDLAFTIDSYRAPGAIHVYLQQMISRTQIIDNYTLRIYTNGVQPYLPNMSTLYDPADGAVLPKSYMQQNGNDYFQLHPIGSGPFKLVGHVPGDSVQYEAVAGHWRQKPEFKTLTVLLVPEEATRVAELKTGAADIIDVGADAALSVQASGFRTATLDAMEPFILFWGSHAPSVSGTAIADPRVRQALSLAINRDEINKTFFHGKGGRPFVAPLMASAQDVDTARWQDYANKAYRYDTAAAKQLLKDAGFPNGFSIKLYTFPMSAAPFLPDLGGIVAGYWTQIGVKVQITPVDWGTFRTWGLGLTEPKPELVGQASVMRNTNNPVTTKVLAGAFSYKTRTQALLGATKPEFDTLLTAATSEPDASKRRDLLAQAIQIGADSWTALPISTAPTEVALGPLVNLEFSPPAPYLPFVYELAKHRQQ